MSDYPDFSAMLDAIKVQAAARTPLGLSILLWGPAGTPRYLRVPDDDALDDVPAPDDDGTGIAEAVTAGCEGMADRRFMRGDVGGAELWRGAAGAEPELTSPGGPPEQDQDGQRG
jgi:hypothetical protein